MVRIIKMANERGIRDTRIEVKELFVKQLTLISHDVTNGRTILSH